MKVYILKKINSNLINKQTLLLLLSSNLNVGQLSSLLQNNSKEAMTNLYQMAIGISK